MYESFYGFHEPPFHVTADPSFLYPSGQHQEALDHLSYGIRQRLGFIVITGEVGCGKTTLMKTLLTQLPETVTTAVIFNPDLSGTQMLEAIVQDFGLQPTRKTRTALMNALNQFLLDQQRQNRVPVLMIDEAQALSSKTLEQVRRLSNLETIKDKLLQIVLIGQPELDAKLEEPLLRPLKQRIAIRYRLSPLSAEEVGSYIRHRLQKAGAVADRPYFTDNAIQKIYRYSGGLPRAINHVCDKALLAGFVKESFTVDEALVHQAIGIIEGRTQTPEAENEFDRRRIEESATEILEQ